MTPETRGRPAMVVQRPISPFEQGFFRAEAHLGSVPVGGMALFIGATVEGEPDPAVLAAVLDELVAGHPLLGCRYVPDADVPTLRRVEGYRAPVEVVEGGEEEYLRLVNRPQDWTGGLFRAVVLRDGAVSRVVLVIHHGIADGRSAFALLGEMWRRYTARVQGDPLPISDVPQDLPEAIDDRLAAVIPDSAVLGLLDAMRGVLAEPPRTLPFDGVPDDPRGRYALDRIELDPGETERFAAAARAAGLTVHSLLSGCALAAVRGRFDDADPLPMVCGYAADIRGALDPAVPESLVLNCAAGFGTPLSVPATPDPVELGRIIDADVRAAREARLPALIALLPRHIRDEATAAMFSSPPTLALSNVGRLPAHVLPAGLRYLRTDVFAMGPGMPPKLTVFTVGDRLTIQLEYDTTERGRARMSEVRQALSGLLRRTSAQMVAVSMTNR
ncbi:phthiocerol/phthiodiolone dimycocerosyl transferase family protein [Nocardia sp. NPDC003482]